jgi:uncharacterized protein (TIGR00269 family)
MFKPKDKTMVALSGGKDSMTLLNILKELEKRFPEAELSAVTVDEGISGYRDEALKIARTECRKLKVRHIVVSFKEMFGYGLDEIVSMVQGRSLTPCTYCGVLRRKVLNVTSRMEGADKLATAHNLDDEIQTMLLNIFHGDAFRIAQVRPVLKATHPKLVPRVKPLCEVPEREIVLYAYFKEIDFQSIPCPHIAGSLRGDIRTMLNRLEEKHPGTKYTIFRSMEKIKPALEVELGEVDIKECKICSEPTAGETCRSCQMLQELQIL